MSTPPPSDHLAALNVTPPAWLAIHNANGRFLFAIDRIATGWRILPASGRHIDVTYREVENMVEGLNDDNWRAFRKLLGEDTL